MSSFQIHVSDEERVGIEKCAAKEHLSIEAFIKDAVNKVVKARQEWERWEERAKDANLDEFKRILAKVPDAPPMLGDELPEGWNKH